MWSFIVALTWTAVAASPLFQTATLGSDVQEMTPGLQEATPGIVLQQTSIDIIVDVSRFYLNIENSSFLFKVLVLREGQQSHLVDYCSS